MSMVSAAGSLPDARSATGALSWLHGMVRWLRAAATTAPEPCASEAERNLVRLVELGASRLGTPLVAAVDLDDLDDRMDDLVDSPDAAHVTALAAQVAREVPPDPTATFARFATALEPVLGAAQVRTLLDAAPMIDAWLDAQVRVAEATPDDARAAHPPTSLLDVELPPAISLGLLAGRRADLAQFALVHALVTRTALAPWLAHALVERFLEGARGHLRLLASLRGDLVPPSLIPIADRFDLDEVRARHAHSRRIAQQSYEEAHARLAGEEAAGSGHADRG